MPHHHRLVIPLVQVGIAAAGITWKINEGFPAYDLPDPDAVSEFECWMRELRERDWAWADVLVRGLDGQGVLPAAFVSEWPWFFLHWFMYVSQMGPLVGMMVMESIYQKKPWAALGTVIPLLVLNPVIGLSSAMPLTSILFLALHRLPPRRRHCQDPAPPPPSKHADRKHSSPSSRELPDGSALRRLLLGLVALGSTVVHVGAWTLAISATTLPSLFTAEAADALHVMHSLSGVPSDRHTYRRSMPTVWPDGWVSLQRVARLRQMNEMVGTSSGFFLSVGLLCDALEVKGRGLSLEAVVWMFLVSLIAGPAAGFAFLLLARDWVLDMD